MSQNHHASLRIPAKASPAKASKAPRKMSAGKSPASSNPATIKAWLSPKSSRTLGEVREQYEHLLDREVSTSLIVRRALTLLHTHLGDLYTRADADREMAALMRQIR